MIPNSNFLKTQLGLRIIESINCVETETVERTWKERLFSWPWKPRLRTKQIFKPAAYIIKDTLVCHPSYADRLRKEFRAAPSYRGHNKEE